MQRIHLVVKTDIPAIHGAWTVKSKSAQDISFQQPENMWTQMENGSPMPRNISILDDLIAFHL